LAAVLLLSNSLVEFVVTFGVGISNGKFMGNPEDTVKSVEYEIGKVNKFIFLQEKNNNDMKTITEYIYVFFIV
jgi:hypothetical protein